MLIAAIAMTIAMALTMVSPAQAYDAYDATTCTGSTHTNGHIAVWDRVGGTWDVDAAIDYDNNGYHHWDFWLYRDGDAIRSGSTYGPDSWSWSVTDPAGPDTLKFRYANDARTINCVAIVYM